MKLNIGSGLTKFDGYLNVDYDPKVEPDYVVDIEKGLLPFEDNSVDAVIAHHILEHIGENFLVFMKELYRICKDGTVIDIEVPHHRHENFFGDPTHKRPITIDVLKKFSKKYNNWHMATYNSTVGFGISLDVDFEILEQDFVVDQDYAELVDQGHFQQIHEMSKKFNNVYSDLRVKLVVIKDE